MDSQREQTSVLLASPVTSLVVSIRTDIPLGLHWPYTHDVPCINMLYFYAHRRVWKGGTKNVGGGGGGEGHMHGKGTESVPVDARVVFEQVRYMRVHD